MKRLILTVLVTPAMLAWPAIARDHWLDETPSEREARMQWWVEARFGMFIHWGLYAIPGGEWNGRTNHAEWIRHTAQIPKATYDVFLDQFNPTRFDADQWVSLAREAGMKYIVITSKHHDGFCLWPSELTDYDVASTPFKRDILGELSAACRKQGVKMCFYHSIMDWGHPNYPPRKWEEDRPGDQVDMEKYTAHMKGQLEELVDNYDPAVMWFDGEWESAWTHEAGKDLYQYVRSLKPDIIINNRVDKGRRGMQGMTKDGEFRGDFGTPEQEIPHTGIPGVNWESCMTMNRHWGWNKNDRDWKSTGDLVRKTIDIASKGGNYLLNIGPKPDGSFPAEAIERLRGIGKWMQANGEAIYETTASPTARPAWGRITTRMSAGGATLYLHVFDWPTDGVLRVPLANPAAGCHLLTDPARSFESAGDPEGGLTIRLTGDAPDPISSTVVLRITGRPEPVAILIRADDNDVFTLRAGEATIHNVKGTDVRLERKDGKHDNIGFWLDARVQVDWPVHVGKAGRYRVVARLASTDASKCTIMAGAGELAAATPATGSYEDFSDHELGEITLARGETTVKVIPDRQAWKAFNLQHIVLRPVE
jgi:alpha-L-fucosidase